MRLELADVQALDQSRSDDRLAQLPESSEQAVVLVPGAVTAVFSAAVVAVRW